MMSKPLYYQIPTHTPWGTNKFDYLISVLAMGFTFDFVVDQLLI